MPKLKILISGAGIAGNALAFWLSKLGHDITVIERFPSLRINGLQLDLRGHGIEVLKRMGLDQAFRDKAVSEEGLRILDKSGRQRAFFPANKSGKGVQSFSSEYEIMRGDLCRIMYDEAKDRAKYLFGTSIERFDQNDNSVEVRFSNGNIDHFDLVVGADGQGSRTRKMMVGPGVEDGFHPLNGFNIGYFTTPREMEEGERYIATAYMATGRRSVMIRRSDPQQIQVYLQAKIESDVLQKARQKGYEAEKVALAEHFRGAGWQTDELLDSLLKDNTDFYCERLGLVMLDSWSRGRVTLVGDAAYCPSSATGMGTTAAIVGAYVLAGEIAKYCGSHGGQEDIDNACGKEGVDAALMAYEERFRPFMTQVQAGVSENYGRMMPSGPFTIAIANFVMGIASMLKLNFIGELFLKESVKDWDLPEYKEMVQG